MPRIRKRAQALRVLCRFQECRLLCRVLVTTLTAKSSSSRTSSSGGLGLQPMETDERIKIVLAFVLSKKDKIEGSPASYGKV